MPSTPDLTGLTWRKSSRSQGATACVEVTALGAGIAMRDSKDRDGAALVFATGSWSTFLSGIRAGEYDLS